jgi:hypothetical protein
MQRLRVRLGTLAVVCGMAGLTLAGGPALASSRPAASHQAASHPAGRSVTGLEFISGSAHGKRSRGPIRIPVRLRGVVRARGFVISGQTKYHAIPTSAGRLTIRNTSRHVRQFLVKRTCHYGFTEKATFKVAGRKSTGAFAGASGPMRLRLYFNGYFPRHTSGKHKGQCNNSNNAPITDWTDTWVARIVLTVR